MLRERVAKDIFVFTSELYLQVTASAIVTPDGAVVVDTLLFPQETREMVQFIKKRSPKGIRYIILTHHHPDHSYGACLMEGELIAHERCRRILQKSGEQILKADQAQNPSLAELTVRLPEIVFDRGQVSLHIGKKTISLIPTPGNSSDGVSAYIREDKVLIAGDLVMPVPYVVGGDCHAMRESLRQIAELPIENIIQGHGEVLLRGEISETIETSLRYLDAIEQKVKARLEKGMSKGSLRQVHIESCHKSRIPLDGMTERLHQANLSYLYDLLSAEQEADTMA
jgi:glyoxylase-like metal-dependent hydrolase (beta-lactamase superfamily II)